MQATPATLDLVTDTDSLLADMELLADAANRFPEVRDRLLGLGQPSLEAVSSDLDALPTAGTFECRVGFQLPEAFRELARAVRAGDFGPPPHGPGLPPLQSTGQKKIPAGVGHQRRGNS